MNRTYIARKGTRCESISFLAQEQTCDWQFLDGVKPAQSSLQSICFVLAFLDGVKSYVLLDR